MVVAGDSGGVAVLGLAAQVSISNAEAALDRVVVNALAGDDVVDASGLAANGIQLTADGGDGDDVLIGGDGNDIAARRMPAMTFYSAGPDWTSSTAVLATTSSSRVNPVTGRHAIRSSRRTIDSLNKWNVDCLPLILAFNRYPQR